MKIKIENDLFDIVNRLKQIDKNYFVLFNLKRNKFELHNSAQKGNSYCLTFPFKSLDARAIEHTFKTSVGNSEKLFFEIEKNNLMLEKESENKVIDECSYKINDIVSYLNNSSKTLDFNNIHTNKWI